MKKITLGSTEELISEMKNIAYASDCYEFIPTKKYAQSLIDSTVSEYEDFNEEVPEIWQDRIAALRELVADFSPALVDMDIAVIAAKIEGGSFKFDGIEYTLA